MDYEYSIPENIQQVLAKHGPFLIKTYHELLHRSSLDESAADLLSLILDLVYNDELLSFQTHLIDSELE